MTRSKSPLVAHVVLMSSCSIPRSRRGSPVLPRARGDVFASLRRDSAFGRRRPASSTVIAAASRPLATRHHPGADRGVRGSAHRRSGARDHLVPHALWPPNHPLIDVGLAVDPTPVCAGLVDLEVAVWSDEPDDGPPERDDDDDDDDGRRPATRASTCPTCTCAPSAWAMATAACTCDHPRLDRRRGRPQLPHRRRASLRQHCLAERASTSRPRPRAPCAQATGRGAGGPTSSLAQAEFSQANHAPIVAAGPDQGVTFPGTATSTGRFRRRLAGRAPRSRMDPGLRPRAGQLLERARRRPRRDVFGRRELHPATDRAGRPAGVARRRRHRPRRRERSPQVGAGGDQSLVLPASSRPCRGPRPTTAVPTRPSRSSWSAVTAPDGRKRGLLGALLAGDVGHAVRGGRLRAPPDRARRTAFELRRSRRHRAPGSAADPDRRRSQRRRKATRGEAAGSCTRRCRRSWPRPVTVDFMTSDGSATAHCDYSFRYGTLTFDPGQTEASILVPVMGELAPEAAETVVVRLGNVTEAILASDQALVTIVDDDVLANQPPTAHCEPFAGRPCDRRRLAADPELVLDRSGRRTTPSSTTSTSGPASASKGRAGGRSARPRPARARRRSLPSTTQPNRLVVLEQDPDGSTGSRVWLLDDASGAGGPPAWTSYETEGGPDLASARGAYDIPDDRLIVLGRCAGSCGGAIQAWILENASGSGEPAWRLVSASGAPPERDALRAGPFRVGQPSLSLRRYRRQWCAARRLVEARRRNRRGLVDTARTRGRAAESARRGQSRGRRRTATGSSCSAAPSPMTTATNEVWALEGLGSAHPVWRRIETEAGPAPAPRFGHAAVFDAGTGRLLVFGGTTPGIADNTNFVFSDAWLLDGRTWTRIAGPVSRARRTLRCDRRVLAVREPADRRRRPRTTSSPRRRRTSGSSSDAMGSLPAVALGQASASLRARRASIRARPTSGGSSPATPAGRGVARRPGASPRTSRPLVDAGADRIVELPPGTVTLAGSVTDDGLPASGQLTMQWTHGHRPGARLSSRARQTPAPTATFSAAGTYVLAPRRIRRRARRARRRHDRRRAAQRAARRSTPGRIRRWRCRRRPRALAGTVTDDGLPTGRRAHRRVVAGERPGAGDVRRTLPGRDRRSPGAWPARTSFA